MNTAVKLSFGRALATPWASAIGAIAVLGSIRNLVDPKSLILSLAIGNLAYVWSVVYGLGGFFMLMGIARGKHNYEAAGCALIAAGALVQAILQLFFLGLSPYLGLWSSVSLGFFAAAGIIRVNHLIHGRILVLTASFKK